MMRSLIVLLLSIWSASFALAQREETTFASYFKRGTHISVPDYLVEVNDLNPEAILQFANSLNETYTMVVEEHIPNSERHASNFLSETMDTYQQKLLARGVLVLKEEKVIIDGVDAIQIEVTMLVEGMPYEFLITFLQAKAVLYKIYSWTLARQKQNYFTDFKKTANSFAIR